MTINNHTIVVNFSVCDHFLDHAAFSTDKLSVLPGLNTNRFVILYGVLGMMSSQKNVVRDGNSDSENNVDTVTSNAPSF